MVAADGRQAEATEEAIGWGRLARELLTQAAKDATWRSGRLTKEERWDAREFFYSCRAEYVYWRHVWFGLAGVREPSQREAGECIKRLAKHKYE